jgi:hypothetical protein
VVPRFLTLILPFEEELLNTSAYKLVLTTNTTTTMTTNWIIRKIDSQAGRKPTIKLFVFYF